MGVGRASVAWKDGSSSLGQGGSCYGVLPTGGAGSARSTTQNWRKGPPSQPPTRWGPGKAVAGLQARPPTPAPWPASGPSPVHALLPPSPPEKLTPELSRAGRPHTLRWSQGGSEGGSPPVSPCRPHRPSSLRTWEMEQGVRKQEIKI